MILPLIGRFGTFSSLKMVLTDVVKVTISIKQFTPDFVRSKCELVQGNSE